MLPLDVRLRYKKILCAGVVFNIEFGCTEIFFTFMPLVAVFKNILFASPPVFIVKLSKEINFDKLSLNRSVGVPPLGIPSP